MFTIKLSFVEELFHDGKKSKFSKYFFTFIFFLWRPTLAVEYRAVCDRTTKIMLLQHLLKIKAGDSQDTGSNMIAVQGGLTTEEYSQTISLKINN